MAEPADVYRRLQKRLDELPVGYPATESGVRMLVPQTARRILCHRTGGTISRATFYRWVSSGKVPSIRLGTRIFIPWPAVDELIRKCYSPD